MTRFLKCALPIAALALSGCTVTGPTSAAFPNQWSPPQDIGQDRFIVEGYDTSAAIAGGKDHCAKMSKRFEAEEIVPHTRTVRATITFRCR